MTMLEPTYETISMPTTPEPVLFTDTLKDEDYYLETLSLRVEGVAFKVPAYPFLDESETFATQHGIVANGQGEFDAAVVLDDVKLADFKAFLKSLLPKHCRYEGKPKLTTAEWASTLKVATQYRFNDLRKTAIDELSLLDMDAIDLVCLGKQYEVSAWLLSGYERLAERSATVNDEEASKIGLNTALRVSAVTIQRLRDQVAERRPPPINEHIRDAFKGEFDAVDAAKCKYLTSEERRENAEAKKQEEERKAIEIEKAREERKAMEEEAREKAKAEVQRRAAELRAMEKERMRQEAEVREATLRAEQEKREHEKHLLRLQEEKEKAKKELEELEGQEPSRPLPTPVALSWGTWAMPSIDDDRAPSPVSPFSRKKCKKGKK